METSTVVPGGDLAGRSAEYRRGYVAGLMTAWPFHVFIGGITVLAVSAVGAIGTALSRADRAEAQLAEMRARMAQHIDVWHPVDAREPWPKLTRPITIEPSIQWFSHTEDDVAAGSSVVEVR